MASEKNFENRIKKHLKENKTWFIKYWAGAMFTKEGIPDILACCNGYFLAIEVKGERGKPSELQKYNINLINSIGGFAVIIYPKQFELLKKLIDCLKKNKTEEAHQLVLKINDKEGE